MQQRANDGGAEFAPENVIGVVPLKIVARGGGLHLCIDYAANECRPLGEQFTVVQADAHPADVNVHMSARADAWDWLIRDIEHTTRVRLLEMNGNHHQRTIIVTAF